MSLLVNDGSFAQVIPMRWIPRSSIALVLSGVGVAVLLGAGWRWLAAPTRGNDPAGLIQHVVLAPEELESRKQVLDLRIRFYEQVDVSLKQWLAQQKTFAECCDRLLLLSLVQYPEFIAGLDGSTEHPGRSAREKIAHYLSWLASENADIYFRNGAVDQIRLQNDLAELVRAENPSNSGRPMAIGSLEQTTPPTATRTPPDAKNCNPLGSWLAS